MSVLHKIHGAHQAIVKLFVTTASEMGVELTQPQYIVLRAVAENDGCSQTALVEITAIDRSTLSDIVRRLTIKGLLTRQRTETDARKYCVNITAEGRTAVRRGEAVENKIAPQASELVAAAA